MTPPPVLPAEAKDALQVWTPGMVAALQPHDFHQQLRPSHSFPSPCNDILRNYKRSWNTEKLFAEFPKLQPLEICLLRSNCYVGQVKSISEQFLPSMTYFWCNYDCLRFNPLGLAHSLTCSLARSSEFVHLCDLSGSSI